MDPTTWRLPLLVVWLIMYGIILCRAGGTYLLGRAARGGLSRAKRLRGLLSSERYVRAEERVNRWGAPIVAFSFLTVGFQTLANLAAGTTRLPWPRYLLALAVGGAAWATVYSLLGFAGFRAVGLAYQRAPVLTVAVTILVVVVAIAAVLIGQRRRRPAPPAAPTDGSDPLV